MRAVVIIRELPHYRSDAFCDGLAGLGYQIERQMYVPKSKDDLLVLWNRKHLYDNMAKQYEAIGARVIVVENGYIGRDDQDRQYYAVALGGHCGSGSWKIGGPERWDALGIELKPYQDNDGHIVVFGQRGIGSPTMASPHDWHEHIAVKLRKAGREVRVYPHPGEPANAPGVADATIEQIRGAHCVVVWSSARGVRAMVEGIPVVYHAPHWIGAGAAMHRTLERRMDEGARRQTMRELAWAQWSVDEIGRGDPFRLLLDAERAAA